MQLNNTHLIAALVIHVWGVCLSVCVRLLRSAIFHICAEVIYTSKAHIERMCSRVLKMHDLSPEKTRRECVFGAGSISGRHCSHELRLTQLVLVHIITLYAAAIVRD